MKIVIFNEKLDPMGKYFMLICFFLMFFAVQAQTKTGIVQTIKGKVINRVTNEAIAYTNIGIENTFYGTASDEEGNFQLKIPEEMESSDIFFSAIGYRNEKFPVSTLFGREFNIIKLEPQSYDIEDIDIAARSKVLIRILRMASENTPYNFLGGPFNLICRLEREKITDDTIRVMENAEVLIYDKTGYRNPSKTDAFGNRTYEITKDKSDYSFSGGMPNFDELLELDWVRSSSSVMNPALSGQFDLELTAEPEIDGRPAWVITFSQSEPTPEGAQDFYAKSFRGQITIDKEDYSVKKLEGSVHSARHNRQGKSLAVGPSNKHYFEDVTYNFEVIYSRLKPDVLVLNKKYSFNGQVTEEKSRLTVTGVQMAGVEEITSRDYFAE